jgi:Tfp pilus assembly protein PilW
MWWSRASSASRTDLRSLLGSQAGFTLVDQLVALTLASIVVLATLELWQKTQETYFRGSEAAAAQQEARAAQQLMVREIRQARSIVTGDTGTIVFESALDPDPAPQRVFDLASSAGCVPRCLRFDRGDGGGAQLVANNIVVSGLQLVYRDAAGVVLPTPVSAANRPLIQSVDITVQGQMSLATDPDPPFTFFTSVKLRNR